MKFTAAGDAIIQKRIPHNYKGFNDLKQFIEQGDARFFNLETTLNKEGECFASQFSGGTYIRTNKEVLIDLKEMGFNMTTFNNNHAFDFSYEGFYKTIENLDESGLVHAGVGMNLDEASAPKFLDTKDGRVALISINTSFDMPMMAGKQTGRVKGRPGVFGVRHDKTIEVSKETFKMLKEVEEKTQINVYNNIIVKEGYGKPTPENKIKFGDLVFELGEKESVKTKANNEDMALLLKSIEEAKFLADYVIISMHSHQMTGDSKEIPADFHKEIAHKCIDAGADAIIGHGPHLLRPIEIYKDRPIFYSLGDFILQLYSVEFAPYDFYNKVGLSSDKTVYELLKTRSKDFSIGLMEDRKMLQSVIPLWEIEDGKLKYLKLLPIEGQVKCKKSDEGLPLIANDDDIFNRLSKMSEPYGVKMKKNGNIIECSW
ncbi:MAG: CapA family protein [Clostridia bacterium]|nr:CapA family protein [Clostridia bacterium]